jgi:hypothetical protein
MIADVNGDGKQDLLSTNGSTASVLLNRGDGTFLPRVDYAVGHAAGDDSALAACDLNGDGRPDLVAGTTAVRRIAVLLNNGDGTFAAAVTYPTAPQPRARRLRRRRQARRCDRELLCGSSRGLASSRDLALPKQGRRHARSSTRLRGRRTW